MPTDLPRQDEVLRHVRDYFASTLLPFWVDRSPDPVGPGFLTQFDRHGRPTGRTTKTFLMQVRMLFTMSSAHRAGYGAGRCAELARMGADFLLDHYEDREHGGWFWVADRDGNITDANKIGYGQCFAMYAFGEYWLATGDTRGREAMLRTYDVVMQRMADHDRGGYREIMRPDWSAGPGGRGGGDRKGFDVHMHMMEALTKVFEVTGEAAHRERLHDVFHILVDRMRDPETGLFRQQFDFDFNPLPAIRFHTEWGRDEAPNTGSIPIDITSCGHNIEFAWLLLWALEVGRRSEDDVLDLVRIQGEHLLTYGVDWEHGGVYIDGPMRAPTTNHKKQFWQQAEALVGCLALLAATGDTRYWDAFLNVYDFVFAHFVCLAGGGEWFHLLERDGTPIESHLADDYKVSYHTVRAMLEVIRRLEGAAT